MNNYKSDNENLLKDLLYLMDNIPYSVWLKDSNGIYTYVNKFYADCINMKPEDIIGKNDYEINDYETAQAILAEDRHMLSNKRKVFNQKLAVDSKNNNVFEVSRCIIENDSRNTKLIGSIGRNYTINDTLYKEIERSTLRLLDDTKADDKSELPYILKEGLEADGISIFVYDKTMKTMNVFLKTYEDNIMSADFSFKLNDYDKDQIVKFHRNNKSIETRHNGKNIKGYVRTYCIVFEEELIGILNVHNNSYDSISYTQEDLIINTVDRLGIIIKNRFLTKQYKIELEKRKDTERELQIFLDNSIDFYVTCNSNHNCYDKESNKKTIEQFFRCTLKEFEKKIKKKALRHPDDEKKIPEIYKKAQKCGIVKGVPIRYLCEGECKTIEWNFRYIKERDKFYLTGKDITFKEKLEKEKIELQKTIEMESLKTDFFANMSHEFKTPLNIILTTVQVIMDKMYNSDCSEEKISQYLKGIKQNSYRLLKIVNNIMDITKIDSGNYNLELRNYNIVSVIEDIVLSVVSYFKQNRKNIIFDTMEEEVILACDPMKIERIMFNLLSNALKHTEENGDIKIFMDVDKEKNEVIVSVENDGEPICEEDKEQIFERFTQSQSLLTRKAEGTGIGLFLVKLLVEMHGGRIFVDTTEKKGAKFVFTIPIKLVKEKSENYPYDKQITSKVETCNIEFSDIYSL